MYPKCMPISNENNAVIYSEITAFGTPGATRTHYIPLRRRTLYPGEVRGHVPYIVLKIFSAVNKFR